MKPKARNRPPIGGHPSGRRVAAAADGHGGRPASGAGRRLRLYLAGLGLLVVVGAVTALVFSSDDSGSPAATVAGPPQASPPAATAVEGLQGIEVGPEAGKLFPDFALTEAGGAALARASLGGKPALIWFTTSYCVPCQIGAKPVKQLDDELGGQAFNVLVVFVDPYEPASALTEWRAKFGNADWLVALDADQALTRAVGLQFLDTKFLLDPTGVVRNVDFRVADDKYVGIIRRVVEAP